MSTTHNNDIWLSFRARISSLFYNYGLKRPYSPSLASRRSEGGFTEVFGKGYSNEDTSDCWKREQESLAEICATPAPSNRLTLVQYRPAWAEQLALRVCKVPHIVVNSPYGVTEATGDLPYLRDLSQDKPILVGRNNSNAILDHLQEHHNLEALEPPNNARKDSQLRNLIEDKLHTALLVCRYQDWKVWEQVTRKQYLKVSSRGQVWSERVWVTSQLPSWSVQQAVDKARDAYHIFEEHLEERKNYLLETSQPCLVDVLFWDHLVQALTDVHLVVALADYPNLCRYAQRLWDTYFQDPSQEWQHWNDQENARNVFCQIPLLNNRDVENLLNASDLMERLSVTSHQLEERMALVAKNRECETSDKPYFQTWYRWRMGDRLLPEQKKEDGSNPEQNEFRKQYKHDDEMWISAVVVASLLVFGLASARSGQPSS